MDFSKKTKAVIYGFAATAILLTAGLLFSWMNWTVVASIITIGALLINGSLIAGKVIELYNQEKSAEPANDLYTGIQSAFLTSPGNKGTEV